MSAEDDGASTTASNTHPSKGEVIAQKYRGLLDLAQFPTIDDLDSEERDATKATLMKGTREELWKHLMDNLTPNSLASDGVSRLTPRQDAEGHGHRDHPPRHGNAGGAEQGPVRNNR